MFKINAPIWEKSAENNSGNGNSQADDDDTLEEDVTEEETSEEEEEFENEFEAFLAKEHPDLLEKYRENTGGLLNALKSERGTAKDLKKELSAFRKEKEEKERKERTEIENANLDRDKALAEAEAARNKLAKIQKQRAVEQKAVELNFIDPTDAVANFDMSSLELNEDGEIANADVIDKELKAVLKKKPHLEKKADLGPGNGDKNQRKLDDDPKTRKKIKDQQPKLAI